MLNFIEKMEFEEEPDYEYLASMLESIKEKNRLGNTFEWQKDVSKDVSKS
jgi:hypothetical protein